MNRRKFILGTGSAVAGGSALLGSGAFSMVESHRSVTVQVAEDDNAYLGMDACQDTDGNTTPNSSFTEISSATNGHLEVDMGQSGNGGSGVNSQSISWFDNVFQFCNQGKEAVCLWISNKEGDDPERVTLYVDESEAGEKPDRFHTEDGDLVENDDSLQTFSSVDDSIFLPVGECVCVGIQVYTKEDADFEIEKPSEGDVLLDQVDIVADVGEEACRTEPDPDCANLRAEVDCYLEAVDDGEDHPVAATFETENIGDAATTADSVGWAVLDSPDEQNGLIINDSTLDPGETNLTTTETGLPLRGIVWWEDDCDPEDVPAPQRDEWQADDDNLTQIDEIDLPVTASGSLGALEEQRYDDVVAVEDFEDFDDEFDDADEELPGDADDLAEVVPEDAFIVEIDFSEFAFDSVDEWEDGDVGIPECD